MKPVNRIILLTLVAINSIQMRAYHNISPYTWCGGNPIKFVDPDGNIVRDTNGKIKYLSNGEPTIVQHSSGPIAILEKGRIFTDNMRSIEVFRNISEDSRFDTDCHGTTFADGLYWINNDQVTNILEGDGYVEVSISDAQKNDVIVYYEGNDVVHTVTIVETDKTLEGTIVVGLGGLNVETKKDNANTAWKNYSKLTVYRKETPDRVVDINSK